MRKRNLGLLQAMSLLRKLVRFKGWRAKKVRDDYDFLVVRLNPPRGFKLMDKEGGVIDECCPITAIHASIVGTKGPHYGVFSISRAAKACGMSESVEQSLVAAADNLNGPYRERLLKVLYLPRDRG